MADQSMDSSSTLSPEEQDVLGETGNISMGAAATALSGLLSKKVDITVPSVEVLDIPSAKQAMGEDHILVKVQYIAGLSGNNVLLVKENDTRVIVSLLMGGDGIEGLPEELGEMEISALGEVMNQMMGSAATAMSDFFSRLVNISPPEVVWEDVKAAEESWLEAIGEDHMVVTTFRLVVEEVIDSSMIQLVPLSLAREMVHSLLGSREEEPATEEEDIFEQDIAFEEESPDSPPEEPQAAQPQAPSPPPPRREKPKVKAQPVEFAEFSPGEMTEESRGNLELIMDVSLPLVVELGKARLSIREILDLGPGSIIELDKLAGEPADLYVNDVLFARGEIVVIEENFGVRISEIVSTEDRIRSLREVKA